MRRVVGYVHRHQAQKPPSDVEDSTWRYSLINFFIRNGQRGLT